MLFLINIYILFTTFTSHTIWLCLILLYFGLAKLQKMIIARVTLFALALSMMFNFSTCHLLKSSVTCLDCPTGSDLAGSVSW
ncbi:hypothetical protein Hanom_Chr01g00079071 [Helianthus anomalus]